MILRKAEWESLFYFLSIAEQDYIEDPDGQKTVKEINALMNKLRGIKELDQVRKVRSFPIEDVSRFAFYIKHLREVADTNRTRAVRSIPKNRHYRLGYAKAAEDSIIILNDLFKNLGKR